MKKIIFGLLFFQLNIYVFSQGGIKQYYGTKESTVPNDYYKVQAEYNYLIQQQQGRVFEEYQNSGLNCYNAKDYQGCIYYYKLAKKTGWYNATFDYAVGISYYYSGNKSKAKSYLRLARKRGSYQAQKVLEEIKSKK